MAKNCSLVSSLVVVVPTSVISKKKLKNKSNVGITFENSTKLFPAQVLVKKKVIEKYSLIDNGCIPYDLQDVKYTVHSILPCILADSISISPEKEIIYQSSKANDIENDLCSRPIDLSIFESLQTLKTSIIQSLIFNQICLTIGTKLRIIYLSRNFIFCVENVKDCLYDNSCTEIDSSFSFKCHSTTVIDIVENKSKQEIQVKNPNVLSITDFGGYEIQKNNLKDYLDQLFKFNKNLVSGILICGPPGSGKSYLGKILSSIYQLKLISIGSEDLLSKGGNGEQCLTTIFRVAQSRSPCIIFIDDIDKICGNRDKHNNIGTVNTLLSFMDGDLDSKGSIVLVIATATDSSVLDPALRRPGRISHDIILEQPTEAERLAILKKIFSLYTLELPEDLGIIAAKTSGFTGGDLFRLTTEAASLETLTDYVSFESFTKVLKSFKPTCFKQINSLVSKISFQNIYGYCELKQRIIGCFELGLNRKEFFSALNMTPSSRFLFFGTPGCGKTSMVHAIAHKHDLTIIPVKRSDVFAKYFGESEQKLQKIFDQAQKCSPCIIHFENFDGLASKKNKDSELSSDLEGRIINLLKVMLDGVVGYENIFIVAESNRPDLLDQNVIRQGRFHDYFFFDLPSEQTRQEIISKNSKINSDFIQKLVTQTEGYSVSEILLVCREIDYLSEKNSDLKEVIEESLERVTASATLRIRKKMKNFYSIYNTS